MSIENPMATWARALEHTVQRSIAAWLPQECFLCATAARDFLCVDCAHSLPPLDVAVCPICALPTPQAAVCGACLQHPPHFDASHALWRYEFPVDALIQALKYRHRLASADFLGRALAHAIETAAPAIDLILPMPLAAARLRRRGFNQAVELARPVAQHCNKPLELLRILRCRDTPAQVGLSWEERLKNMHGAFESRIDLSGLSILVIDDVITSGATLDALAASLKAHGAIRVENWLIARSLKPL
ncbi:MAG TPA: ComF family protein [Rhodocyclaceae bacterium]|nr:ComF family protein [Rhodocyclaceae bacterium]